MPSRCAPCIICTELTKLNENQTNKQQPNISDNSKVPNTISNSVSITPAPPLSTQNQQHNDLKVQAIIKHF